MHARKRIIVYPQAEKRRLVESAAALCERLGRPVCSRDLAARFAAHPEERPCLLQPLGQQLFKAANRDLPAGIPRLWRVGLHGNTAFYAPDDGPRWRAAFGCYVRDERAAWEARLEFFDRIRPLFTTERRPWAANAAAGWIGEVNTLLAQGVNPTPAAVVLRRQVERARPFAAPVYVFQEPRDLIPRREAEVVLRAEFLRRSEETEAAGMNCNRHLAFLASVSPLKGREASTHYCSGQLESFCAARWSVDGDDGLHAGAALLCYRFGIAGAT